MTVGQQLNRARFQTEISLIDLGSHQQATRSIGSVQFSWISNAVSSERLLCKSAGEQQRQEGAAAIIRGEEKGFR